MRKRIRESVTLLAKLGDIGRPSKVHGWREFPVRKAPYVVVYRIEGEVIDVLAVYHTAEDR